MNAQQSVHNDISASLKTKTLLANQQTFYPTSAARFCVLVCDAVREQRGDLRHLLTETDIPLSALSKPNNKIPLHKVVRLWERAAEVTQDPFFGLNLGKNLNVKSLGSLGYMIVYSSSVEMALKNFARFLSVNQDATETCIEYAATTFSTTYGISDATIWPRRQEVEASVALRLNLLRIATGFDVKPIAVHFEHDAPADIQPLVEFFGANLHFNSTVNKLTFDRKFLNQKLLRTDANMLGIIEEHISKRLQNPEVELSFSDALEMEIRDAITEGYFSSEAIAQRMAMSSRTMRRRLHKERKISFQDFVKRIRYELASSYLSDPKLTIGEISYLVGYSEDSAFCRAFRNWSNMAPMEYRSKAVA